MRVYKYYLISLISSCLLMGCDNATINTEVFDSTPDSVYNFSTGIDSQCSASHSMVGLSESLSTLAHGVSGTITIIDDCTLEITNFSYDGGGPAVYFYTGRNGNFTGSGVYRISTLLTGTAFSNNTLRLVLPSNITLDDFNSVSVWCVDFNANFGDVRF